MAVIRGAEDWTPNGHTRRERENEQEHRLWEMQLVAEHDCFFCHKPLTYPAIYWASTSHLLLHPDCVRELTARLMRDVDEVGAA